jgi:hypothetical protein
VTPKDGLLSLNAALKQLQLQIKQKMLAIYHEKKILTKTAQTSLEDTLDLEILDKLLKVYVSLNSCLNLIV